MNEPQEQNQSQIPLILNIFFSIAIVVIGALSYIYGNFDGVNQQELENNYIHKDDIRFSDLGYTQKENYIQKSQHDLAIQRLQEKLNNQKPKIITKEKVVEVQVPRQKSDTNTTHSKKSSSTITMDTLRQSNSFQVFRCYGMNPGNFYIPKECKADLDIFLEKNKDALFFEVIAIEDTIPFIAVEKLQKNPKIAIELDISKTQLQTLEKYSKVGLDKLRVTETIWEIKQKLGNDTLVFPVNYYATSQEGNRGTVIRAYH